MQQFFHILFIHILFIHILIFHFTINILAMLFMLREIEENLLRLQFELGEKNITNGEEYSCKENVIRYYSVL